MLKETGVCASQVIQSASGLRLVFQGLEATPEILVFLS